MASDERFQLTAVKVGDEVCTTLTETTDPVTTMAGANCWDSAMFAETVLRRGRPPSRA